jgi:phosphoribosyl 1,2-cyclic phosphodiesterase
MVQLISFLAHSTGHKHAQHVKDMQETLPVELLITNLSPKFK